MSSTVKSESLDQLNSIARQALSEGRYQQGIAACQEILRRAPNIYDYGALRILAACYIASGDRSSAIEALERALEQNPQNLTVTRKLEALRRETERFEALALRRLKARERETVRLEALSSRFEALCHQYGIRDLYHITHIDNLRSILQNGLLANNLAPPDSQSIANPEIQEARHLKVIPGSPSLSLHDCVPLFFALKTPMLSVLREMQEQIIHIHIDPRLLLEPGTIFTDGNARSRSTSFYNDIEYLTGLNWQVIRASYWGSEDSDEHAENKRVRAAEVLVPRMVPPKRFQGITVMTQRTRQRVLAALRDMNIDLPLHVDRSYYF